MKVSVTQKASVAGAGRQMPSGGDTAGDYLLYQTPAEPAGLERGMEVSLGHTFNCATAAEDRLQQ